jgi:hypothetical protein
MAMGLSRASFLNNHEGGIVGNLAWRLVLGFRYVCWQTLAANDDANPSTGNVDRPKMLTTPLMENMIRDIAHHRWVQ